MPLAITHVSAPPNTVGNVFIPHQFVFAVVSLSLINLGLSMPHIYTAFFVLRRASILSLMSPVIELGVWGVSLEV
jgi:hypothetical protein